MKKYTFLYTCILSLLITAMNLHAQDDGKRKIDTNAEEKEVPLSEKQFEVLEKKQYGEDTLPTVNLNEIEIYSPRYTDPVKASEYARLRRNVMVVYPYAKMAAEILEEIDAEMEKLDRRRHQRRYAREKQRELRDKFEAELRDLTISQGKILVQLINRETGDDCYRLISELRSGFAALSWQTFARFHGYDLKEPYLPEENPDLERIVQSLERSNFPTDISRK